MELAVIRACLVVIHSWYVAPRPGGHRGGGVGDLCGNEEEKMGKVQDQPSEQQITKIIEQMCINMHINVCKCICVLEALVLTWRGVGFHHLAERVGRPRRYPDGKNSDGSRLSLKDDEGTMILMVVLVLALVVQVVLVVIGIVAVVVVQVVVLVAVLVVPEP